MVRTPAFVRSRADPYSDDAVTARAVTTGGGSGAAVGVEDRTQRRQRVTAGAVEDVHSAPLGLDQPGLAELSEVVGHGGFTEADRGGEVTTVLLPGRREFGRASWRDRARHTAV